MNFIRIFFYNNGKNNVRIHVPTPFHEPYGMPEILRFDEQGSCIPYFKNGTRITGIALRIPPTRILTIS
jgi:hypothetical protein